MPLAAEESSALGILDHLVEALETRALLVELGVRLLHCVQDQRRPDQPVGLIGDRGDGFQEEPARRDGVESALCRFASRRRGERDSRDCDSRDWDSREGDGRSSPELPFPASARSSLASTRMTSESPFFSRFTRA